MVKLKGKTAGQTGQEQFISKGKIVLKLQGKLDKSNISAKVKLQGKLDNISGILVLVNLCCDLTLTLRMCRTFYLLVK